MKFLFMVFSLLLLQVDVAFATAGKCKISYDFEYDSMPESRAYAIKYDLEDLILSTKSFQIVPKNEAEFNVEVFSTTGWDHHSGVSYAATRLNVIRVTGPRVGSMFFTKEGTGTYMKNESKAGSRYQHKLALKRLWKKFYRNCSEMRRDAKV